MSTLHTISKSPAKGLLSSCAPLLKQGDALMLLEDGVYYSFQNELDDLLAKGFEVYCLSEDLLARGPADKNLAESKLLDYEGFVDLCCEHDKLVNWF